MAARPEYEENGVHCSAIINPLAVRTQRVLSFMLRDEWSHFLPESITDLPLVARHTSPSEIIILYYLTIPFGIGSKDDAFLALGNGEFLYIPIPIWILIILLLINHFILTKTTFGRKIYITGGNKEAAIYSGINVTRLKIKVFMITAVLAGISGMILASRLYSGQPNSALSYELDAIAAAVLGGTSLNGGYGTVVGTVIGALTIGVINNGMNLMNVPYFYQMVVKGLVILVAVYFDVRNKRKRS